MAIDAAAVSGHGQLKWVDLRSSSIKGGTGKAAGVTGSSAASFAALLQQAALESASGTSGSSLTSLPDASSLNNLLWQQLGGSTESYGEISGK